MSVIVSFLLNFQLKFTCNHIYYRFAAYLKVVIFNVIFPFRFHNTSCLVSKFNLTVNPLLSPPGGAYLYQAHLRGGGGT